MSALEKLAEKWDSEGKDLEASRLRAGLALGFEVQLAIRADRPSLSEDDSWFAAVVMCGALVK